jgi:YgiT-type zinc finger domain-containing protein
MTNAIFVTRGILQKKNIEISFWWGNQRVHFSSVPALSCDTCGEKYFSPEVSKKLTQLAKDVANGRRQPKRIEISSLDFSEQELALETV